MISLLVKIPNSLQNLEFPLSVQTLVTGSYPWPEESSSRPCTLLWSLFRYNPRSYKVLLLSWKLCISLWINACYTCCPWHPTCFSYRNNKRRRV